MAAVQYPVRAAKALGYLKSVKNDVEIFVEDTGNRNMWLSLLRCLLPQGTRLGSISMLGGKDRVLAACKLDQIDDGRRKLYIVDADLDKAHGRRKPNLKYLHRLMPYCVENLLISRQSVGQVAIEAAPTLDEKAALRHLDWTGLINSFEQLLRPLFLVYAAVNRVAPSTQTVSFSVMSLLAPASIGHELDSAKVRRRMRDVIRQASALVGLKVVFDELRAVILRVGERSALEIVSGKDYLLPLLQVRLRGRLRYTLNLEQLKARLAACCYITADWRLNRVVGAL